MLKKLKRLAAAITAAAVMSIPAIGTGAEEQAVTYDLSEGSVTISEDGTYIITQSDSTATTNNITVEAGVNADITLSGVNIRFGETAWGGCAFKIADNSTGSVTVRLAAETENYLISGPNAAGLQKNGNGEDIGKLTITGEGYLYAASLNADSSYSAGIGGSVNNSTGNIEISRGVIEAVGGGFGPGIGCGGNYSFQNSLIANDITISGGNVTAIGGYDGAGIGSGHYANSYNITISGGTVTANGGDYGAGIGGGDQGSGSNITISGGNVTANGGDLGSGIGGGRAASQWSGNGTNITISGGVVTANGGYFGAGIGGGDRGNGSNITISGGTVTANGRNGGAGIGNGDSPYDGNNSGIVINGGSVKASSIGNAQPTDGNKNNVYLLTISNGNDETVVIDDKVYAPVNHKAADPEDGNLYAYLTGEEHTVWTGLSYYTYEYDGNGGFTLADQGQCDMEIIFTDENDEILKVVHANNGDDISALAPAVPEKDGIAGKWDTDLSTVTESCTVKAIYQIKVTFVDENNEVIDTVYAYADEDISALAPEIPEKEGYTGAWDTDLGAITESCTVKAVYTEIPDESSEESSDVSSEESSDITSDESSDVTSDSNTESGISDESAGSSDTESVSDSSSDSADSSKADSSASGSSDKNPSTGAAAGAAAVLLIGAGVAVLKKRG